MSGYQTFSEAVARWAARTGDATSTALARQLAAPLRIGVRGRRGVGRSTTVAALRAAGYSAAEVPEVPETPEVPGTTGARPELTVRVLAEVCKPEDRTALRAPVDVVLWNKADLAGWVAGGPLQVARRQAADLQQDIGVPTRAFVAPLACAGTDAAVLDAELVAILRRLVAEPADLSSPEAFVAAVHPVPSAQRARLIATLDVFGVAHAVVALRTSPGAGPDLLRATLAEVSGIGEACEALDRAGHAARYRRVADTCAVLELRAVTDPGAAQFLTAEEVVLARMSVAMEVMAGAGLQVAPGDDAAAHLDRARTWRDYRNGPVSTLYRACADDIVRGSLRLLAPGKAA